SYRALKDLLLALDFGVDMRIANSVWSRQGFPFEEAFFAAVDDYFDAEAQALDFSDPASVDVINDWASDATNGRIDKVLDRIEAHHIMFLLNAIYFKGKWQRQFDRDDTRPAPFTRADGSRVTVPMMRLEVEKLPYAYRPDYQAVE